MNSLVVLYAVEIIELKHPILRGCFSEFSDRSIWCTIADVKITFPDDIDDDIEAIRELLADADKKELPK